WFRKKEKDLPSKVQVLQVSQGDILVVHLDVGSMGKAKASLIIRHTRNMWKHAVGPGVKVLVSPYGVCFEKVSLEVLRRAETTPAVRPTPNPLLGPHYTCTTSTRPLNQKRD